MMHYEGTFAGVRGIEIHYQYWLPERKPRALLLIVHGLAEHSARYANIVNYFVPLGYAIYGFDHIGHGKSAGKRVYVRQFDDFVSVLSTYIDSISTRHPEVPLFMFGHSLGALISVVYLLDPLSSIAGAVLSGPLVEVPDNISAVTVALSRLLSLVIPTLGVAAIDPTGVSRSQAVVRAYLEDPLVHTGRITARLAYEMLRAMRHVARQTSNIKLPLLVMQGNADRLVSPQGAETLYRLAGSADKTLKVYDGLYHELHNEPERELVFADVEEWLRKRSDPTQTHS